MMNRKCQNLLFTCLQILERSFQKNVVRYSTVPFFMIQVIV